MNEIRIALRNMMRNTRRSILTMSVMLMGIMFTVFGLSYFDGAIEQFVGDSLNFTGHITVNHPEYPIKEKMLDVSVTVNPKTVKDVCSGIDPLATVTARIKFGALVFHGDEDKQAIGMAIEESDEKILGFDEYIYKGKFLDFNKQDGIIAGRKLAEQLDLDIGSEVTLLSQTQYGSITALNYKVVGLYDLQNGRFNRGFYMTMASAQDLLDMPDAATDVLIFTEDRTKSGLLSEKLKKELGDKTLVRNWDKLGMNQQITTMVPVVKAITVGIFCFLSAIAVVNTMMMVVFERKREIGIMKSLGMTDFQITRIFCMEGTALGTIGAIFGGIVGGGLALYFSIHGINLGAAVESVPMDVYMKNTIYFYFGLRPILYGIAAGICTAFMATLLPVLPGVRKVPAALMRD